MSKSIRSTNGQINDDRTVLSLPLKAVLIGASGVIITASYILFNRRTKKLHQLEEERPLPPGWKRLPSKSKPGYFYYCHAASARTQWTFPQEEVNEAAHPSAEKWDLSIKSEKSSGLLILIRHGQSAWNRQPDHPDNLWRYAGAVDVPLSQVGIQEAVEAGEKFQNIPIDVVFCSMMDRAKTTVMLSLASHFSGKTPLIQHLDASPLNKPQYPEINDVCPEDFIIPVFCTKELNERNFGKLQGVPSTKHTEIFTKDEITKIRNDYETPFPDGESSADVYNRAIPYLETYIIPHLAAGRNVLVSSHGFCIRAIIKYLEGMSRKEWNEQMMLEKSKPSDCRLLAPTGVPLVYTYENGKFRKMPMSRLERSRSISRSSAAY